NASFLLALFLTRGVVSTVLLEVAFFATLVDLRGDDRTVGDERVELALEPVVRFLGQPGHIRLGHLDHSLVVVPGEPGFPETGARPVRGRACTSRRQTQKPGAMASMTPACAIGRKNP